ncbi:MAG: hypothetical protein P8Y38_00715 [Deltaproteobacteria bacterium]
MPRFLTYSVWRDDHQDILEKLKHKQVLMTYSGGKDSSIILHFIQRAAEEFDFSFETHAVPFPSHVFPENEKKSTPARCAIKPKKKFLSDFSGKTTSLWIKP